MFVIPDLSKTSFFHVDVEISAAPYDFDPVVAKKLEDAFSGEGFSVTGVDSTTFSRPCRLTFKDLGVGTQAAVQLGIQMEPLDIHRDWFEQAMARGEKIVVGSGERSASHHVEETASRVEAITAGDFGVLINEKLAVLYGIKVFVGSEYEFRMRVADLPVGGIIGRGVAARAQFAGDVLRLAGAQFVINAEDEEDSRLNWSVDLDNYPHDWQSIRGSMRWIGEKEIVPTLLSDLFESAQRRFDRFVLESEAVDAQ